MIKPTGISRFNNYIFKNYAKDSSKLLVHVGTGVTVIGASAQVGMLLADKDIEGHTKKYLVNQEIITSGCCIGLYYTICDGTRRLANRFLEQGKFLTEKVAMGLAALNKENQNPQASKWKDSFTKDELKKGISYTLEHIQDTKIYKNASENLKPQVIENAQKTLESFRGFKNGSSVLAVLLASIFAGNIAGPILGNFIASLPAKKDCKQTPCGK